MRDVDGLREHYELRVAGWLERFEATVPQLVGAEAVRPGAAHSLSAQRSSWVA